MLDYPRKFKPPAILCLGVYSPVGKAWPFFVGGMGKGTPLPVLSVIRRPPHGQPITLAHGTPPTRNGHTPVGTSVPFGLDSAGVGDRS
jgi:hypothetical protein